MDLTRLISKLFSEHIEEGNRIIIITKGTSKRDLAKYEKDIKKNRTEGKITEKTEFIADKTDN